MHHTQPVNRYKYKYTIQMQNVECCTVQYSTIQSTVLLYCTVVVIVATLLKVSCAPTTAIVHCQRSLSQASDIRPQPANRMHMHVSP